MLNAAESSGKIRTEGDLWALENADDMGVLGGFSKSCFSITVGQKPHISKLRREYRRVEK